MAVDDDVHEALDALIAPVLTKYREADPEKVGQLEGALATTHMVIQQLDERAAVRSDEQGAQ